MVAVGCVGERVRTAMNDEMRQNRQFRSAETEVAELDLDAPTGARTDLTRLYRLWEENQWSAMALDFTHDRHDWDERFTPDQRRAAIWVYSLFLQGEESVARTLAPFAIAAPTQEQRIFLTTQIVDEARHHVFFSRFLREVAGSGHDITSTLAAAQPHLTTGFRQVFGELDRVADRLRRTPRNLGLYAQSIVLYHIIVEGTLAHPGQHFIRTYMAAQGLLPAFAEGIASVARDESRHMAFGVQVLHDLVATSREVRTVVVDMLNRVLPWSLTVFAPPHLDENYTRVFGFTLEETYAFGLRSLETKLRRIGIDPAEINSLVQVAVDQPVEEQARRALAFLRSGVLGGVVPVHADEHILALVFDSIERLANMRPSTLSGAVQWRFAEAPPWYVERIGTRVRAQRGEAEAPVLTLHCRVADWLRIAGQQLDPRWAVVTGRLRLEGSLGLALRLSDVLHLA